MPTDETPRTPMHWARWGDPAEAGPLPAATHELVELAFGPAREQAAVALDEVTLPEPGLADDLLDGLRDLVGAEQVAQRCEQVLGQPRLGQPHVGQRRSRVLGGGSEGQLDEAAGGVGQRGRLGRVAPAGPVHGSGHALHCDT